MPEPSALNFVASPPRSQLFTVRLWREDLGDGRSEWRGQVQHVMSGHVRYFRDWQTLVVCVRDMLASCVGDPAAIPSDDVRVEPSS